MRILACLVLAIAGTSIGCKTEPLTAAEAQEALEESSVDGQAAALTSASIELSSDFTIGQAAQQAASEIRDFVASQLSCARITLANSTLTIEYGALPGTCTYRGQTFQGTHTIAVMSDDSAGVVVSHTWKDLSNGRVSVSGTAQVTWSTSSTDRPSRRVVHGLTWTRLSDRHQGVGAGDRTQRPLAGGIAEGFEDDGSRSWSGARGRWQLDIDRVEMRWVDPVPQAGSWVLHTPFDKTLTLKFERIDEDSIGVTASSGDRTLEFQVDKLGAVSNR